MRARFACLLVLFLSAAPARLAPRAEQPAPVRPARVEVMQNLEVTVTNSFRPAYLPREWGRLVGVERLDNIGVMLFLEAADGEIYLVRLSQRGGYLFLDTSDRGGVAIRIPRQP